MDTNITTNPSPEHDDGGEQQDLLDDLAGDRAGIVDEPARGLSWLTANLAELHRMAIVLRRIVLVLVATVVILVGAWTTVQALGAARHVAPEVVESVVGDCSAPAGPAP